MNFLTKIFSPLRQIDPEEGRAYGRWVLFENIRRLKLFGWIGSLVNLAVILVGVNAYGMTELSTSEYLLRFFWIVASFVYILLVGSPKEPESIDERKKWLFYTAAALSLVLSMLITVTYTAANGYTFLFIVNMLLTGTFLYMSTGVLFLVAAPSFFIFVYSFFDPRLQSSLSLENSINIVAVSAFVLVIAQMNYLGELAKFRLRRLVEAQNLELRDMAEIDELTGVGNRRKITQYFAFMLPDLQREKRGVALLLLDIDHFKLYNDNYGHPAGDGCLREIARILGECVRRGSDFIGRYGGEEFILILPGAGEEEAWALAEKIRQAVFAAKIPHPVALLGRVTVSIGVAVGAPGEKLTGEDLILRGDTAMYQAKRSGRNRCFVYRGDENG